MVIASNRGPVSFVRDDDGNVVPTRGAGGLVTALVGAVQTAVSRREDAAAVQPTAPDRDDTQQPVTSADSSSPAEGA